MVPDPTAKMPTGWDDEMDGSWEAPLVPAVSLRGWQRFQWEFQAVCLDSAPWLVAGIMVVTLARPLAAPLVRLFKLHPSPTSGNHALQGALGALLGLLLPCCSCGILPIAAGIIAGGGSSTAGIAMAFVASGSGLDSFFYTVGAVGFTLALGRMAAVAMLGFLAANVAAVVRPKPSPVGSELAEGQRGEVSSCCKPAKPQADPVSVPDATANPHGTLVTLPLRRAAIVALNTFDDVAPAISAGIALTAALTAWGPDAHSSQPAEDIAGGASATGTSAWRRLQLLGSFLPVQMCEHAIVHVCKALLHTGVSPGTVFAVLTMAPSTSVGWYMLVANHHGHAGAVAAVVSAVLGSLVLSYGIDKAIVTWSPDAPREFQGPAELPHWFTSAAPFVLGLLAAGSVLRAALAFGATRFKVKQS